MKEGKKYGFATTAIHAAKKEDAYGALAEPIYQTSTYSFKTCKDGADIFAKKKKGFAYSRSGNPTVDTVERKIATLENGEAAMATSSGMGAISSTLWSLLSAGDHVIADKTLYGCTYDLLAHQLTRMNIEVSFIDVSNDDELDKAFKANTKVVYLETPANPNLKITDIAKVSAKAHAKNPDIKVICDNTFCSPYVQRPLEEGADIVVHSATKYINGHGDLLAGFVISDADTIATIRGRGLKSMSGSVLAANEAFLMIRGLKTLEIRMDRHCESAMKIARFLHDSDKIEKVFYPGLEDHIGHEVAKKQMHGLYGGMVSFIVKGGRAKAEALCDSLDLCTIAVSLGDAETLIEHPASMTHATYSAAELEEAGIPEGLIRLSVGLENVDDIIEDLREGLAKI